MGVQQRFCGKRAMSVCVCVCVCVGVCVEDAVPVPHTYVNFAEWYVSDIVNHAVNTE